MNKILVLYHASCLDGFGSAFAAWKKFGTAADYIPLSHTRKEDFDIFFRYETVYILDFAFSRKYMESFLNERPGRKVVLIDHHKTAYDELHDLVHPDLKMVWDFEHSGAVLTWTHFFPHDEIPGILLAIEDRDLWNFNYPDSKRITSAIYSYKRAFYTWESFDEQTLVEEGAAILRYQDTLVRNIAGKAFRYPLFSIVQTPVLASDVCNYLLENVRDIKMAVSLYDKNAAETQVSLRSTDYDVEAIAKQFGGGGHENAAGFSIPRTDILAIANRLDEIISSDLTLTKDPVNGINRNTDTPQIP